MTPVATTTARVRGVHRKVRSMCSLFVAHASRYGLVCAFSPPAMCASRCGAPGHETGSRAAGNVAGAPRHARRSAQPPQNARAASRSLLAVQVAQSRGQG